MNDNISRRGLFGLVAGAFTALGLAKVAGAEPALSAPKPAYFGIEPYKKMAIVNDSVFDLPGYEDEQDMHCTRGIWNGDIGMVRRATDFAPIWKMKLPPRR